MSMTIRIIIDILFAVGIFFSLAGVVGMLRMPDTFCRMQSSTNIATLGFLGIAAGAFIYAIAIGNGVMAIKIAVVAVFIIVSNPIGAHAICKGAYKNGVRPEKKMVCDEYGRDMNND